MSKIEQLESQFKRASELPPEDCVFPEPDELNSPIGHPDGMEIITLEQETETDWQEKRRLKLLIIQQYADLMKQEEKSKKRRELASDRDRLLNDL